MVFDLLIGFVVLVAASYVGTTMALRGFFGRERYSPPAQSGSNDSGERSSADESADGDEPPNPDKPPNPDETADSDE